MTALNAKITHVIFDMDGLLIDTERLYSVVYDKCCAKYGKTFTFELKLQLMGRKTMESAQKLIEILNLPITAEQWVQETREVMTQVMPQAKLLPGVDKLIRHLHKHAIPIAVASGSNTPSFKLKTAHLQEFFGLFHHIVCSGDDPHVKNGKPAPDIFRVAAERFQNPPSSPENVLVFEDAPNGIQSGRAAGMWTVMIPDERLIGTEESSAAHLVLRSMDEFMPDEWGLPAYDLG